MFLGKVNEKYISLAEISGREIFTLVPLAVIVVILGVYPHAVLDLTSQSLNSLNQLVLASL